MHSGEIRVGVPPMYGIRHIPKLLMQFRARYPGIAMHVVFFQEDAGSPLSR